MNQRKMPLGSKRTRTWHDDELARVDWREFERIIGRWYASKGYTVDYRGTGSSGRLTDGGVDLVLKGHGEKILVQCKHAKALQVPYNEAMQLRGLIHAEDDPADRGILITSGEFTSEALRKARNAGLLEMIDGKALRELLGADITWLRDSAHGVAPPVPTSPLPPRAVAAPPIASPGTGTVEVSLPPTYEGADRSQVPGAALRDGSHVTSRPVASRVSRGMAAACVVICLGVTAVVGIRSREDIPTPLAQTAQEPVVTMPARPTPTAPRRASHEPPVVNAKPPGHPTTAAKTKILAPRPSEEVTRIPAPVIYRSSNMSDAEFAAWKQRKAQRERGDQWPATEMADSAGLPAVVRDPVRAEPLPTEAPGVPAQTMQVILRTNRRQPN